MTAKPAAAGATPTSSVVSRQVVQWPKVLLFGDSITQYSFSVEGCWGSLLADRLQRKCDVINRGFSGYNTRWNKIILPQVIDSKMASDVIAVTIFLGANDSNVKDLNPRQHVPLDEYQQNLVDMVEYLMSIGISHDKVILICPPPCDYNTWAIQCEMKGRPMSKTEEDTAKYAKACHRAAEASGAHCVDLYTEMCKQTGWEEYLEDGLHLSAKGSTLLDKLLWPVIEKLTRNLPMIFPAWDEVDFENPQNSFPPVFPVQK